MTAPAASRSSLATTHAHYSHDWHTPPEWLDWVAVTLGTWHWHDPCPADWQPGDDDGLEVRWSNPAYCNHPGSRRSTFHWWSKYLSDRAHLTKFIWAAFSVEQFRHMRPSALELPGWLVLPRTRIAWVWGGPDIKEERDASGKLRRAARRHGEPMRSPGNWSGFWTTTEPARPPVDCIVVRTGI